jgi:hypothetical protein
MTHILYNLMPSSTAYYIFILTKATHPPVHLDLPTLHDIPYISPTPTTKPYRPPDASSPLQHKYVKFHALVALRIHFFPLFTFVPFTLILLVHLLYNHSILIQLSSSTNIIDTIWLLINFAIVTITDPPHSTYKEGSNENHKFLLID